MCKYALVFKINLTIHPSRHGLRVQTAAYPSAVFVQQHPGVTHRHRCRRLRDIDIAGSGGRGAHQAARFVNRCENSQANCRIHSLNRQARIHIDSRTINIQYRIEVSYHHDRRQDDSHRRPLRHRKSGMFRRGRRDSKCYLR